MIEWKDMTSYKQGDRERKPRSLRCNLNDKISISVHKHIYYENEWLLSCNFLNFEQIRLGTEELEEAKRIALVKVRNELAVMNNMIERAILDIEPEIWRS